MNSPEAVDERAAGIRATSSFKPAIEDV